MIRCIIIYLIFQIVLLITIRTLIMPVILAFAEDLYAYHYRIFHQRTKRNMKL